MDTNQIAANLDAAVRAVCPEIDGVSVGNKTDKQTWVVAFRPAATQEQRDAAASAIAALDLLAPTAEEQRQSTIRTDSTRAEWLTQLKTASNAQIETFVRSKINADAVTSLATAQTCLKRIETALVLVAKLIALDART